MSIMEKKICSRCKIEKFLSDFQKNKYSKDGHRSECSDCSKISKKSIPKERIISYGKKFREKHRIRLNEKQKEYYHNNIEKEKKRKKNTINKKIINSTKTKKSINSWQKENKDSLNKIRRKKYHENHIYRLSQNVRNRLNSFLKNKGYRKKGKTFEIIGCSPSQLKEHIEKQFKKGMSWENRELFHIDHIIPLSSAKTEEELYKLSHYTNLQPLWIVENLKKGNKKPVECDGFE